MIHSITYQAGTARRRGGWLLRSRREHEDDLRIADVDSGGFGYSGHGIGPDWPGLAGWPGLVAWRATSKGVHLLLTASAPTPRGADPRFDRLASARGYYDEWIAAAAAAAVVHHDHAVAGERWLAAHAFGVATTGQAAKPGSAPLRGRR